MPENLLIAACIALVLVAAWLAARLRAARRELGALRDRLQQVESAAGELQGRLRRLDRERPQHEAGIRRRSLEPLLELEDHVQRALDHGSDATSESWREGVLLLGRSLEAAWVRAGLRRIAPEPGSAFDPAQHEAIASRPGEAVAPCVGELVSAGFADGDQLLRAARVVVDVPAARAAESAPECAEDPGDQPEGDPVPER